MGFLACVWVDGEVVDGDEEVVGVREDMSWELMMLVD